MKNKIEIDIRAYNYDHNCNISYRLNERESKNPEILREIISMIERQMVQHIESKEKNEMR